MSDGLIRYYRITDNYIFGIRRKDKRFGVKVIDLSINGACFQSTGAVGESLIDVMENPDIKSVFTQADSDKYRLIVKIMEDFGEL